MPATIEKENNISASTVLSLISNLPLSSPTLFDLLTSHSLLSRPSILPSSATTKFLTRLNASVVSRDSYACALAARVVEQDEEGFTVSQWGKGWMGACLGSLGATSTSGEAVKSILELTTALILVSPHTPSFEREVVHPAMGKLAVTLARLINRLADEEHWEGLLAALSATKVILIHSPPPFRPSVNSLRPILTALLLHLPHPSASSLPSAPLVPPIDVRLASADLIAVLHLTSGKAASPAAWGNEMRDALGGISSAIAVLTADGWEEEPPRINPLPPPALAPGLPVDPHLRPSLGLVWLEGWVEVALALLRLQTSRPVPVPLSHIVSCGLRCLNLTLETPTTSYISPLHHAAIIAILPQIWTCGLLLITQASATCGDHLLPHLGAILEYSVYLLERLPRHMTGPRTKLLLFHAILLQSYPAAIVSVEYITRLLRYNLSVIGTLLDTRPAPTLSSTGEGQGSGKKNKKRSRGAEDALIRGLEGRTLRVTSQAEANVIRAAVKLSPLLHPAPLLSPALLTFSIRLHLSLYLSLPSLHTSFESSSDHVELTETVRLALEHAALMNEGCGGTSRDMRTVLLALLPSTGETFSLLLHPALPPMARPMPPLAQLHYFAPESEEEKTLRREMGFAKAGDDDGNDAMVVDDDDDVNHEVPSLLQTSYAQAVLVPTSQVDTLTPLVLAPMPTAAPTVPVVTPALVLQPAQPVAVSETVSIAPAPSEPFMSIPSTRATSTAAVPIPTTVAALAPGAHVGEGSDDEAIPDLDSGSEDEDDEDEDME